MTTNKLPTFKTPLILSATLFVLGTTAYWLEFSKKPKDEEKKEVSKRVFNIKDKAISQIELTKNNQLITLKCTSDVTKLCKPGDNSQWQVTSPLQFAGDNSAITSLVSQLSTLSATETIDLSTETPEKRNSLIKDYGLDENTRLSAITTKIKVTMASGENRTMWYGGKHPIGDSLFVLAATGDQVNLNSVYVVANSSRSAFEHPLSHWRDKKVLSLTLAEVIEFELSGGKNSSSPITAKKDAGRWGVQYKNEQSNGDDDGIDSLLSSVVFLNAKGFAENNKSSKDAKKLLASSQPALKIKLKTKDKDYTLQFWLKKFKDGKKEASQVYVTSSTLDPVYELETTLIDRLDKGVNDLRQLRLLSSMDRFQVNSFTADSKNAKLSVKKTDPQWPKVEKILDLFSGKVIQKTHSGIKPDTETSLKIKIGITEKPEAEYLFWKSGTKVYGQDAKNLQKTTLELNPELLSLLPWTGKELQ